MANTISSRNQQLFDPTAIQQSLQYQLKGLTYISNNNSIHPRDEAGNIVLHENSETNPLLIIEPVKQNIVNSSVIRVLDTAFQYFKFPVSTNIVDDEPVNLDINLDASSYEMDMISTRYVIPYKEFPDSVPNDYYRLSTSSENDWYVTGAAGVSGYPTSTTGPIRLPFKGSNQTEPGTFILTPDTLKQLRNQNKTIKFSIQMQTRNATDSNTAYRLRLVRENPKTYREWSYPQVYTESGGEYQGGEYPILQMEYIIDPNDTAEYDKFSVDAVAGTPAWYLGNSTYWDIQLIDIVPGLLDNSYDGVTSVYYNNSLIINNETVKSGKQ